MREDFRHEAMKRLGLGTDDEVEPDVLTWTMDELAMEVIRQRDERI